MSAFSDIDTSFLDNINAEPDYTANKSNNNDILFQGSPLAEIRSTSNEIGTPIYSRETSTSPTPNEFNPIDDLLLPAGDSHIANIPREAGAPTNFQDNDSWRQQANKKRKRERSNERKQKFRNKEKELVCQLRSLYDPGRQKNMTKHELLIEAIQEIKQCRNNHYENINDEL